MEEEDDDEEEDEGKGEEGWKEEKEEEEGEDAAAQRASVKVLLEFKFKSPVTDDSIGAEDVLSGECIKLSPVSSFSSFIHACGYDSLMMTLLLVSFELNDFTIELFTFWQE